MSAPGSDFRSFVGSLATGAASALAEVERLRSGDAHEDGQDEPPPSPQEVRKQIDAALAVARQLIDTLAMLEAKTAGNLSPDESESLRSSLTDLRITFVRVSAPTN
jgi:hypothetical protein